MQQAIVSATQLTKQFGDYTAVDRIDFDIRPGICFGILGPNGAGKTTLMRMLMGLSPISSGSYTVFDQPVSNASTHARIGVVPQQDNLDPDFTVKENLSVFAGYFGIKPDRTTVDQLLEFASLTARADAKVATLSGGMRRRLMIARALINSPDLIILDEPTTGLDPQARHLIWQRLRSLKQQGKTLILTTHYMDEAAELCDELMVLDHGHILARGEPSALLHEHVEPEVITVRGFTSAEDARALASGIDARIEHIGDTWFFYSSEAAALATRCSEHPELTYMHRPATLEDLFLKLTGRDLREEQ